MKKINTNNTEVEVILGNSNRHFSGVTSTMLQTLQYQKNQMVVRVLGKHHLSDDLVADHLAISFWQAVRICRKKKSDGNYRIFHARRNNEMIQAYLLRALFLGKIKIMFTSTAQRHHSRFTKYLMSKMDAVISTCDGAAKYLVQKPAALIPHGVQVGLYHPSTNRRLAWHNLGYGGEYGIAMFGRVREQKGVHLFVNACLEVLLHHPQYTALIVGAITRGNRRYVEQLKEKIKHAGLSQRIIFTGELSFARIPVYMRAMSLVVALSDNEGFGLTPLESMASGVAVLTTKAGAWPEIVQPGVNGFIENIGDQKTITQRLNDMLSDPDKLIAMGKAGHRMVLEKYTTMREARALCALYKKMSRWP